MSLTKTSSSDENSGTLPVGEVYVQTKKIRFLFAGLMAIAFNTLTVHLYAYDHGPASLSLFAVLSVVFCADI